MLFNSVSYLIFFPVVVLITFLIPNKIRYIWLLITSYFFYMNWNARYGLLILTTTIITYSCSIGIEIADEKKNNERSAKIIKKAILTASLFANFGLLFYFKYTNFMIRTISSLSEMLHANIKMPTYDILLPVGISFFIFQAVGYTIDVYRGDIKAEKNVLRYALFVSFFPQLVAGPIERSENLLTQLRRPTKFNSKKAESGLLTIVYGLFLKIVIADNIARLIDPIFVSIKDYNGMQLFYAVVLFAFQIYCDFEGYSLMAIGSAEILGYKLHINFNAPYLALSVKDFWRRWHISLTSWFRDYLYIPLGGSHKGKVRKQFNTMIVFLCSGLWHGAAWKYVAWGGVNGILSVTEDLSAPLYKRAIEKLKIDTKKISFKISQRIITFVLIDFTWLFFRANSFRESFTIIKSISTDFRWSWFLNLNCILIGDFRLQTIIFISILIAAAVDFGKYKGINAKDIIFNQQILLRWGIYWSLFMLIIYSNFPHQKWDSHIEKSIL